MTVILKSYCYFILQIMLLLSILFLFRGHNYPGGGFIGALIACSGIGLTFFSGYHSKSLVYIYQIMIALGIILLTISFALPTLQHKYFLTSMWQTINIFSQKVKLGTPLIFDIGIYLAVFGSIAWVLNMLGEDADD